MNSSSTSRELARALFAEELVPLAAAHPGIALDFAPEPADGSFYRPAYRPRLDREAMERGGRDGELAELAALWGRERPELLALMPGIERLAAAVAAEREVAADDPDAPSTLIYQMY